MIYMVTGGAGFLGSRLCDTLIREGHMVICVDNYTSGNFKNIEHLVNADRFFITEGDVEGIFTPHVDGIFHLASPTDPATVKKYAYETLKANGSGIIRMLEYAHRLNKKFLFVSSVKVHGDCPRMTPYIIGKRYGEALCLEMGARVARLANTYGPGMAMRDSRVIPVFIDLMLRGDPVELWQGGGQIDSFCYVDDIIDGLIRFMESDSKGVIEFGAESGITIRDLADKIAGITGKRVPALVNNDIPVADECHKVADISRAKAELKWLPGVQLEEGLKRTVEDRKKYLD